MLSQLSIKNFAIIDDMQIEFQDGLSVLTGETGAGKSIIIQAVNLLLGSRASSDFIRAGAKSAELEAFFVINKKSKTAKILKEQGLDNFDDLIIRRLIFVSGKSQVFINSRQVTLEFLKQATQDLVAISSQHAHQGLLKDENHLNILDQFANTISLKKEVNSLYNQIIPLKKKIVELKYDLEKKKKEKDFLEFQINEIKDANISPNEDEELEIKRLKLLSASKISETLSNAVYEIYDKESSIIEKITEVRNNLQRASEKDKALDDTVSNLSSTVFDLHEIIDNLRDFSGNIDLDPLSLENTEKRLDLIARLKRKYGKTIDDLFGEYETMKKQLFVADQTRKEIKIFEKELDILGKKIGEKAIKLSNKRKIASKTLLKLVKKELEELEMDKIKFETSFSFQNVDDTEDIADPDNKKVSLNGIDQIHFCLSPNPGEALRPLSKIASGGELSRIVLALKAVLSQTKSIETLIFDEVDAGIGGAVSEKVGLKLKQLSEKHQVICITHLAQIARYAKSQMKISKEIINNRTCTKIHVLTKKKERIEEIARMISGTAITQATLNHAKELLNKEEN